LRLTAVVPSEQRAPTAASNARPNFSSLIVAEHQARSLERVLADEHEREKKHADRTGVNERKFE
jgi:hypothetical protein